MAKTTVQRGEVPSIAGGPATEEDYHYLPDEIVGQRLLRCSARWLKEKAYKREIPHTKVAGRVAFRMEHIRQIRQMFDVDPAQRGKRAA